jgi:hypothetical protein
MPPGCRMIVISAKQHRHDPVVGLEQALDRSSLIETNCPSDGNRRGTPRGRQMASTVPTKRSRMVAIGLSLSAAAERAADRGALARGAAGALSLFGGDERPAPKIEPRFGVKRG